MSKKAISVLIVAVLLAGSFSISGKAATRLSYWYAYDDNGYVAEALVYGIAPWNNANFLPFTLSYLAYTSSRPYNVSMQAGSRDWISSRYAGLPANAVGKTVQGEFDGWHEN